MSIRAEDGRQKPEARIRTTPPSAHLLQPDLAPDVAKDEDRDDHVIERADDRDELRDQVNRIHDPGEQHRQGKADPKGSLSISQQVADQAEKVRNDGHQVAKRHIPRSEEPEDKDEGDPRRQQAGDDANDQAAVHRPSMPSYGRAASSDLAGGLELRRTCGGEGRSQLDTK